MSWLELFAVVVVHAFDRAPGWVWSLVVEVADRLDWLYLVNLSIVSLVARRVLRSLGARLVTA